MQIIECYEIRERGILVGRIRRELIFGNQWVARTTDGEVIDRDIYRHDLINRLKEDDFL